MTIILAIKKDNQVWIGGDRLSVQDDEKAYEDKIIKLGRVYIGAAGYGLLTQILVDMSKDLTFCADFMPTSQRDALDFAKTVFKSFMEEIEIWPKKAKEALDEEGTNNQMLIATPTQVFYVDSVLNTKECYDVIAIGSGSDLGLGALWSHYTYGRLSPKEMVLAGIDAACHFHTECGGIPQIFQVHEDEPKRKKSSS